MGTLGVMHLGMARVVSFSADRSQHPPPVFLAHFVGDACVRERFARLPKGRIRRLAANIAKLPAEGPMVDSFIFYNDWIIAAIMIGVLVTLIGAFLYRRCDHD